MTTTERLIARSIREESGCLRWSGAHVSTGYGHIKADGKPRRVHRVAYEAWIGPIPDGLDVDHLCGVRDCIEPTHLEAVTHRENLYRGTGFPGQNQSKTRCKRGHELPPPGPRGKRQCPTCETLKVQCSRCGRFVNLRGLARHHATEICISSATEAVL